MRAMRVMLPLLALLGGCSTSQAARTGPPPLILISMDTFRADRLGVLGNPDGLTPNLDAFAAEAVVFQNAYSQAVQTAPSHASVFTSRYPTEEVGPDRQPNIPKDFPMLAQLLQLYNYHTGAFVAGGDLARYSGLTVGFDTYEESQDFGSIWHTGPMALAWLKKIQDDRPYFMFVHGYDTHSHYLKPPPYGYLYSDARTTSVGQDAVRSATERLVDGLVYPDFMTLMMSYELLLRPRSPEGKARTAELAAENLEQRIEVKPEDVELIRHVYDGAVSYADTMVGLFLAALQDRGVLDEAVVVIMGDHGEQLGEHGLFGHCCEVNEEETHVPLMIRMPKGEGGGRKISAYVELVDIMPTLLELAGATLPARIKGQSLLPAVRGEPFTGRTYSFTEGSEMMRMLTMRGPKGRLTWSGLSPSSPLLPDILASTRLEGPGWQATEGLGTADRAVMRDAMIAWSSKLSPPPQKGATPHGDMPEALKKSLREHGYWDVQ
jgi:arylsulfatase A-like enzyme